MGDVSNFLLIVLRSSIWLFVPCKIRAPLKLKPSLSNSVPKCPRVAIHANFRVHLEPIIDPKFTDRPPRKLSQSLNLCIQPKGAKRMGLQAKPVGSKSRRAHMRVRGIQEDAS